MSLCLQNSGLTIVQLFYVLLLQITAAAAAAAAAAFWTDWASLQWLLLCPELGKSSQQSLFFISKDNSTSIT